MATTNLSYFMVACFLSFSLFEHFRKRVSFEGNSPALTRLCGNCPLISRHISFPNIFLLFPDLICGCILIFSPYAFT